MSEKQQRLDEIAAGRSVVIVESARRLAGIVLGCAAFAGVSAFIMISDAEHRSATSPILWGLVFFGGAALLVSIPLLVRRFRPRLKIDGEGVLAITPRGRALHRWSGVTRFDVIRFRGQSFVRVNTGENGRFTAPVLPTHGGLGAATLAEALEARRQALCADER